MIIDLQVSPAVLDWPAIRDVAQHAEAAGFGAFHVFDHLAGVPLGGTTMIECFSLLGALAESTASIQLGTMVANVWNRRPGTLVTAAASIAHLSGRQVLLGIGAGTSPASRWADEQHAAGHAVEPSMAARHARVREVLALASGTWAEQRSAGLTTFPLPSPTPLMIVGVNSVALSRLAGRFADGINVQWSHPRRNEFIDAANEAARERRFLLTAYTGYDTGLFDPDHPTRVEMAAHGIERVVLAELGGSPALPDRV